MHQALHFIARWCAVAQTNQTLALKAMVENVKRNRQSAIIFECIKACIVLRTYISAPDLWTYYLCDVFCWSIKNGSYDC